MGQDMQALEVEGETNQAPFASSFVLATQRELAKAQDLLDDADDGLYGALACAVDELAKFSLQLVGVIS